MNHKFILNGKNAVPCDDLIAWGRWMDANRSVAKSGNKGAVRVSTVFLGLDHSFVEGPPMLFETMIFGGKHDQFQERYATWDEAQAGHKVACALAGVMP